MSNDWLQTIWGSTVECDPKFGKYKKTAHVLYSDYPICHTSLVISPIMFQLIGKELKYEMG